MLCLPRADSNRAFPGTAYIATILNRTIWDHIYIVKPPGPCGGRTYKPVLKYILDKYSNRAVFSPGNSTGLNEFLTLARANKFVQDKHSTFSFWAGYFSVGTEVHIDIAGLQPAYPLRDDKFVYHDESKSSYFGSYGKDDSGRGKNRIHFAYIHDMG